jgi:hypothetical protein
MDRARQMEEDGQKIIKLNIGNLAVFGFDAPEEIQQDMIRNLPNSAGYSDSKGIFGARKAVMHETQRQGIKGVGLEDIYLGNGASELIVMATNGLLDDGDELLLPAPDYPLWTAAVSLSGGTPIHYMCDEANGWMPNIDDIRKKITPHTKGIVVINPNNPTGALYSDNLLLEIIALAREHCKLEHRRADFDIQLALEELSLVRLPRRLVDSFWRQKACSRLHRGLEYALEYAFVRQRSWPMGDSNCARRLPKHQRFGGRGWSFAQATRYGL